MSAAKPCKVDDCERPKKKGKHFCEWHWLRRQSSDVQGAAARVRLARWAAEFGEVRRHRVPAAEWPAGERWCAGCQNFVPLFYCSGSRCRGCSSMAAHEKRLEKTYGIDAAEYDRIFAVQGGRCAICRNRPASIRFAVDHDHQTGAVRGILCKRCNHDLLGGSHDSVELLWRAIEYLLFPTAQRDRQPVGHEVVAALDEYLRLRQQVTQPMSTLPEDPPF